MFQRIKLFSLRIDVFAGSFVCSFVVDRCGAFRCFSCPICTPESVEKSDDQVKVFDQSHLRDLNKKKFRRENSSKDLTKNWKTIEDEFVQVMVLTNACLWSFAPQGLSKNGHLADGVLDLILIRPTNRKEFLRYVKRNGNSKDQVKFFSLKNVCDSMTGFRFSSIFHLSN